MTSGTSMDWIGNRVSSEEIPDTDLVLVQWFRPWNGTLRGVRVLDRSEMHRISTAVEQAANGDREHPRRDDLAGRPLDLEEFLDDVLD